MAMSAKASKSIKVGTILTALLGGAVYLRDTVVANQGRIIAIEAVDVRQDREIDKLEVRTDGIGSLAGDMKAILEALKRIEQKGDQRWEETQRRMDAMERKLAMMPQDSAMALTSWCQIVSDGQPCSYIGATR